MNTVPSRLLRAAVVLLAVTVAGCATYYQPRYGHDGVYYDDRYAPARTARVYAADPVYYPYWSLDYFYFSRYYHPYSVFVGYHDPFYYPYPGWYYGYRPGARVSIAFSHGFYYPWFGFGVHYHRFHPWRFATVHHHHHHHRHLHPVRRQDARLRELQRSRVVAVQTRPTLTGAVRAQQTGDGRTVQRPGSAPRGTLTRSSRQQGESGSASTRSSTPAQRSRDQARESSARPTLRDAAQRSEGRPERRSGRQSGARPTGRSSGIDMSSFQRSGVQSGSGGDRPAARSPGDFSQARAVRPAARSRQQQDAGALTERIQRAGPGQVRQATRPQSGPTAAGPRSRESAPSRVVPAGPASRAPTPPSRSAPARSPESSPPSRTAPASASPSSRAAPRSASPPSRSTRQGSAPSREASGTRGSSRSGSRPSRRDGGGRDRRPD